jgi:hypothetical protein
MTNQTEQGAAGWKSLPPVPTDPMIDAFENAMEGAGTYIRNFGAAYRAMLAAAPNPTPEGYTSDCRDAPALDPVDLHYDSWPRPTGGMQVGMPVGVLMRYKPTGITVIVDNHRSQHRNRDEALRQLAFLVNFCTFKDEP